MLLVEDFIFFVVGDHIIFDKSVIDDGRLYGFSILFNLAFGFQLITHVRWKHFL